VHNVHVVTSLEAKGAIFVDETDQVPQGQTVVFSAHGVSPMVHEEAAARNLKTIDATCPLVTKVHHEVRRFATEDAEILLIGHHGHEEVEGTAGEAPDKVRIVDGLEGARTIVPTPGKNLIWLSQTTLSVDETMETVAILKERFPDIQAPPSDDICYATQNRQEAIKVIAPQADLVIVVGSQNSSNSVRLAEVALEYGAKASHLIDYAEEIQDHWFTDVETIGVTSGASVPEILVKDVLAVLAENGFRDVQEITAAEESLLFALPPELRKDMKAAGIA
jgi:4-hydroxy-3-methylbut-2-en-1-yl diphosphate reductase